MKKRTVHLMPYLSLLFLLVVVSTVFVVAITFAGTPESPDATATYNRNQIRWDVPTDGAGTASLNIFGDPAEGEEYPTIDPYSNGTYYLRLANAVSGNIGYSMYVYCENPHEIPLSFDIVRDVYMQDAEIPAELSGKQVLASVSGTIGSRDMKTFTMPWSWDTETDEKDTALGNKATGEDLLYTLKIMFIIEDNNTYETGGNGSNGIKLPASGTSSAKLRHRAYVKGYPDGSFRPDGSMTRAEVSAIFARILADFNESALTDRETDFLDVAEDSWFTPYIARMESMNLIKGYPDGNFLPDGAITRAEFAAICVRFYEKRTTKIKPVDIDFTDLSTEHWSYETIQKAVANGYVKGYPDGSFRPDQNITRAEVVTVVNRILERSADKDFVDKHIRKLGQFTDTKDNEYWAYYDIYEATHEHVTTKEDRAERWEE